MMLGKIKDLWRPFYKKKVAYQLNSSMVKTGIAVKDYCVTKYIMTTTSSVHFSFKYYHGIIF